MKLENGTPWKSASMARALPIVLILMALTEFGVMVLTKEGNTASALY